ncbi:hypothetical protein ACW9HW_27010 [Pseudomonas sp. SDO5532_S415]
MPLPPAPNLDPNATRSKAQPFEVKLSQLKGNLEATIPPSKHLAPGNEIKASIKATGKPSWRTDVDTAPPKLSVPLAVLLQYVGCEITLAYIVSEETGEILSEPITIKVLA